MSAKSKFNPFSLILMCLFTITTTFPAAQAAEVKLLVSPKLYAKAEFLQGKKDISILLSHGFLTTNKFSTIQTMLKTLNDDGFSVLAPNLTLGVNLREDSLKCGSLHTHTLEGDVAEIDQWIQWLTQQGYQKIILLGHSSGSQELLLSQVKKPNPAVKLAIFTSLFYFNGKDIGTRQLDLDKAENLIKANEDIPQRFNFLFCMNNYFATPKSFLSYQQLTRQKNLTALNTLSIPSYTIMGGADQRYKNTGQNWLTDLQNTKTHLIVIKGANHFFNSEHEFDLQDEVLKIIHNHFPSE